MPNVIRATLAPQTQAICGTGNLAHVGVHSAYARIWASSQDVRVRLAYRTADGVYSYTPWVTPPVASDWSEIAFGVVTIGEVTNGAQQWDGRIEAYSATVGDTLDIDYFLMLPAERAWKIRAPYRYQAGPLVARDEFTGTTSGNALGARTAPLGGAWNGEGAATDFTFTDTGGERLQRATVSDAGPRYAVLGSNVTDQEVGVDVEVTAGLAEPWLIARWVDSTNFLAADLRYGNPAWRVFAYVGGVTTVLGEIPLTLTYTPYKMRLVVFSSGHLIATLMTAAGATVSEIRAYHSSLATGGALASGKPGIADQNANSAPSTRYYDNFYAATPPAEPIAIHSGRLLEIRHDSAERQSADGLTWGKAPVHGGRVYVPCAGDDGRATRLWIKAKRNDVDVMPDANIADSTAVTVTLRPRYRFPTNP